MEFDILLSTGRHVGIYGASWFREEWGWEFSYKCDDPISGEEDSEIREYAHTEFPPDYNPYEDIEVDAFLEERAGL